MHHLSLKPTFRNKRYGRTFHQCSNQTDNVCFGFLGDGAIKNVIERLEPIKIFLRTGSYKKKTLQPSPDDANSDVNEMWSCIQSNLLIILENNVPSKLSSSKSLPPWINNETKRLIWNKKLWYKKA